MRPLAGLLDGHGRYDAAEPAPSSIGHRTDDDELADRAREVRHDGERRAERHRPLERERRDGCQRRGGGITETDAAAQQVQPVLCGGERADPRRVRPLGRVQVDRETALGEERVARDSRHRPLDECTRGDRIADLAAHHRQPQESPGQHPVVLEGGDGRRPPAVDGRADERAVFTEVIREQEVRRLTRTIDPVGTAEPEPGQGERADREAVPAGEDLSVECRRLLPGPVRRIQRVVAALDPHTVDGALTVLGGREPAARLPHHPEQEGGYARRRL